MNDRLLSRQEVADMMGVHYLTVYQWTRKGLLKPLRYGRTIRYRLSDVVGPTPGQSDGPAPDAGDRASHGARDVSAIDQIRAMRAARRSFLQIADRLNAEGVPAGSGRPWTKRTVRLALEQSPAAPGVAAPTIGSGGWYGSFEPSKPKHAGESNP